MKWLEENLYLVYEWILTFSNKKSLLSSKRIERFVIFVVMLLATIAYLYKAITSCTIGATDFMVVIGGWLVMAGFNATQIRKDVKDEGDGSVQ